MEKNLLQGKKAVIVGGAGEIGAAIAELLLEYGAKIMVFDVKQAVSKYSDSEQYKSCLLDIRKVPDIRTEFELLGKQWQHIDILVHAAGINLQRKFAEVDEQSWDATMDINLKSAFFCAQAAYPYMAGGGKIVLISSISSRLGYYGVTEYCTSKGGIDALTRNLAIELATDNIQVNAIAPGTTKTRMTAGLWSDPVKNAAHTATIPMRRIAEVQDHAKLALFLVSKFSDFVTGTVIPSDGGQQIIQADFMDVNI